MISHGTTYDEVVSAFCWAVPDAFNIGVDVAEKWADRDPGRIALEQVDDQSGNFASWTIGVRRRNERVSFAGWHSRLPLRDGEL